MNHDFDWSAAPPPWTWIGPEWREKCLRLAAEKPPLPRVPPIRPWVREAGEKGRATQRAAQKDHHGG